jgi:hypothetical protein
MHVIQLMCFIIEVKMRRTASFFGFHANQQMLNMLSTLNAGSISLEQVENLAAQAFVRPDLMDKISRENPALARRIDRINNPVVATPFVFGGK